MRRSWTICEVKEVEAYMFDDDGGLEEELVIELEVGYLRP